MKLKNDFIITQLGEDCVLVPVGETAEQIHGIVRLNETATFIVNCLKEDTTPEQIVNTLLDVYEVDRSIAEGNVNVLLNQLKGIGVVED